MVYGKSSDLGENRKCKSMIAHNSEELLKINLHSLKNRKKILATSAKA